MDSSVPGHQRSLVGWLSRYAPGPMRRKVDRVESAITVLALLVMITAIPIAVWAGSASHDAAAHRAETSQRTEATLLENAPQRTMTEAGEFSTTDTRVKARWTAPDGTPQVGKVAVQPGLRASTTVSVWLDESGRVTRQPPGPVGVQAAGTLTGIAAYVGIGMLVCGVVALFRWRLDRVRATLWEHEWELVAPIWTRQY